MAEKATVPPTAEPHHQMVIIGGGIMGAFEAYYAYLDAVKAGDKIKITIYEKGSSVTESTAYHIFPSLTPDEILSVVPRGPELIEQLAILFSLPGGIRVDDVPGVNDSLATMQFKEAISD